ncbi:MAG: hypothetical protein KKA22_06605 [Gammaproteobacteria bacterium]|nr:hypothetical protein [Gammaproteobacteria bacterium]MBU1407805.1 hypothetical protein [Gammaproteobacteria bacterium]MBU1531918.1 hypothetical protein [Gammaproteobacteria bacterium]
MIYVVEFPHQGRPHAWFAFNRDDFVRKVHAVRAREGWVIHEALSVRERVAACGTDTPDAARTQADLLELARVHGWDALLYRADPVLGQGVLHAEPVDAFDACVAALAHDLKTCRVHLTDDQAIAALQRDPLYDPDEGFYAHMALRQQLIAMDAMEEDI